MGETGGHAEQYIGCLALAGFLDLNILTLLLGALLDIL